MPWHIEGTYFENCSCDMVCPYSTSGLTAPADDERCDVALAFRVETGEVDGVYVGSLTAVIAVEFLPGPGLFRCIGQLCPKGRTQSVPSALG
ncbi:hypothetical protein JOE31_002612 [Arthrobacter sp. PvP023]|uniref:DUF1326 domain-containing protein n=1 Tax=Micrococcaceae TaxID=1268 RepID=UPI001AE3FF6C|nr:DUF1326 domain-containing protein [Arthrobacter sp. PvP023]MBP1136380.1 hypothetical protein [Arthrobacter sp. PvP023]